MKKLALISSYCNTEDKITVLLNTIDQLQKLGIDVLLHSPIDLPQIVIANVNHYFKTSENPVLTWPIKGITAWKIIQKNGTFYMLSTTIPDHGWAGLFQTKVLSEIASMLDYDRFYHMIYDVKFDHTVVSGLMSSQTKTVYSYRNSETIWQTGLHFMIFDKPNLLKFANEITLSSYLENYSDDAFSWLNKVVHNLNFDISPVPVEDLIDYYSNVDIYDISEVNDFKVFASKNGKVKENMFLLFYDCCTIEPVKIYIDGTLIFENNPSTADPIDLGFSTIENRKVEIEKAGIKFDISSKLTKLTNNIITKL